ncbi:glycoside hydrolase family 70 protein [Limosilactobacillus mucosae]|uniref:glycoside hydrolase family 70 protein n=1 Tax=Limosilactobacillus mucosae TaxID=97478 RepID=UPI0022DF9869|nr:glycoside hydrolase family 70 protein [Limosilactobacillus mucosae]
MTKEHKKMYKAGKNWIVATLTATIITLLGGIGAYTVHADTTIESSQDVQTTSVNQTNQVDNSNDSVTINQPVAVQSSQTTQNDQSVQGNQTNQTVPSSATAAATNNSVTINQPVAVQSSQTAQNDQSVQGNQTNQTVPSSATAATTNNSDGLDSNIYGTVNVKDWDYQINNNILNLTKYHGDGGGNFDYYHIVIPNLNDFNNANINISGIKSVGITSNVLKDIRQMYSQTVVATIAISKTQGVYNDKVVAENSNWASTFKDMPHEMSLEYADLTNLDASKITNVESLFEGQISLKEVKGLDSWDTSKVTNMGRMFLGTLSLKTVGDLSNWDTSNVTNMFGMFTGTGLTSIGSLSNWNTSNVTNMSYMFEHSRLHTLNLGNWNTSNVTDMSDMFQNSYLHEVGNLSNWDTSKVINMSGMFSGTKLTSIGSLSNWNTSNVFDMSYMFQNSYLHEVGNLSNWDTSKLTYPRLMFDGSGIDYFAVSNEKQECNNQIKIMDNLAVMGQTGKTIAIIKVPAFYKDTSGKSKAQIVYDTVLPLVKKTADEQYKIFYDSLDTDIKKNFPSDILLERVHPGNISNSSEVANSIFEIKLPGIQTVTINYIDPDGKVVKTDQVYQVSGKVGDKVDVKISLPDGYELANKDEQVPSNVTVTKDGIKTITVTIKKIPESQTGNIRTGFLNLNGHTYYFGDGTRWENRWMNAWGNKYYFKSDGARATNEMVNIDGATYYFDGQGVMKTNYFLNQKGKIYYFGNDGKEYRDRFYTNWGHTYYFGTDGARYTNQFYTNWGHTYYFGADGARWDNKFYTNWGNVYYFGTDGARWDNRWMNAWGNKYYFKSDGARATNEMVNIDGATYYFDGQGIMKHDYFVTQKGKVYYFGQDGKEYRDRFYTNWGHTYYFGTDGARYTNQWSPDKKYYFGDDGAALKLYGKIVNGKLSIYDATSNELLKTLDSGDWENLAYSFDSSSINNTDGYLSYAGWYRPYGTSQDGKTWHKTTVSDWRPLLMYVWPSKDVEAKYIKYFVNNGYTSTDYGLTKDNVANLSQDTDSATLNKYARNLRFIIEKSIAINKSTGPLANDINKFMTTIPELSAKSELPVEYSNGYVPDHSGSIDDNQLVFVNNNSSNQAKGNTSYADSNYRLMNRTINNQTNNDSSDHSPELLVGNDIDNSNPVVQAENLNWEYFLLNYGKLMQYNANGNFDGFRVDAADNIDADVLDQLGQLMNDLYHTKGNQVNANSHLVYNEGYHSGAARMLDGNNNPELYMDAGYFYTLENVLGRNVDKRDSISNLVTNSIVNRANDVTENTATPNWSFVTNHDQRKNVINQIIIDNYPGVPDIMSSSYKPEYAQEAWDEFYADQAKTDKQYAQYNLPAQYALLLSNKDTVPQVYYGDLYNETDQYMKTKSMYYDAITTLMKARRTFVNGGQTMTKLNNHLIASVRYGKGVSDVSGKGTDSLSRTTGMAVIVGNNPTMREQVVQVNMGVAHANERYQSLINSTDNGLTYDGTGSVSPAFLTTDSKGILRVTVKGYSNPYVNGYLSVWVPVISGVQDAQTNAQEVHNVSGKTFASNAALDAHMIYEDFSLFQPEPTTINNHAYNVIKANASLFNQLGITDLWMAPAYMPFNMSRYHEGYAMTDRYNLGTTDKPTKYGSGEELADAIAALHQAGLKVQEDLVMNQMIGFSSQEAVTVTRANRFAKQLNVDGQTFANQIYFGYTRGGGQGQQDYGGRYLVELKQKYPDLFTTKAASTGVAPDPNTQITEWFAKYENGTTLQNIGVGLAIKMPNGYYAYLNDGSNKTFNTTLPDAIASVDYYVNKN